MQTTTLENADSKPFWAGVADGRLLVQRCDACGHVQFPPRRLCAVCWSEDLSWIECSGRGVVESFTVVDRAPTPAFRDKVPYVVASIRIEEGPRFITNILGPDATSVAIDDPVQVTFAPGPQGQVLPQFVRRQP